MILQVGVKALIADDKSRYLFMLRSSRYGEIENVWDIPGGRINTDESLEEALAREVREEVGLEIVGRPRIISAQDIFVQKKDLHVARLTYEAMASGDVVISEEHTEIRWMSKIEALREVTDQFIIDSLNKV